MDHLWPMLRLKADTSARLFKAYKQVYIENYVKNEAGMELEIYDWMGNRVYFHPHSFNHAFSESTDYRFGMGEHSVTLSQKRARRVLWIKEVLMASKGHIERRSQLRRDGRGRLKKRRVLIVVEEKYVVVLEEMDDKKAYKFITAFPADENYLQKIRKESSLQEIKNPSLNGD